MCIISSRNYVLQCYQVWKWKLISISDSSKVELKSCLELLSVLNFIGNSIVAVNNSKQTDLDLCSDKSFRIKVNICTFFQNSESWICKNLVRNFRDTKLQSSMNNIFLGQKTTISPISNCTECRL